ncbi:MAG: hypothetical protein INR73_11215 [Williamsia sp.]|nr:hypothetical protein [Williamsia sp.]
MNPFHHSKKYSSRKRIFVKWSVWSLVVLLPLSFVLHSYAQKNSQQNRQALTPAVYLISMTASADTSNHLNRLNAEIRITGMWQSIMGMTKDSITTDLVFIPAAGKDKNKLAMQLQAVPGIRHVSVVPLSNPATPAELAAVRKVFAGFDLSTRKVSNKQLSLYLRSIIERQDTYYIDQGPMQNATGLRDMHIKRLEEHPQYSPEWRKPRTVQQQDNGQQGDSLVVQDVELVEIVQEEEPPSPPDPPANLRNMSDAQIRQWWRKNDSRKPKNRDIQITRTDEEVKISLRLKTGPEIFTYQLKK